MARNDDKLSFPFLKELCPDRTESEIKAADEKLRRYLAIVIRVCNRKYGWNEERRPDDGILSPHKAEDDDVLF